MGLFPLHLSFPSSLRSPCDHHSTHQDQLMGEPQQQERVCVTFSVKSTPKIRFVLGSVCVCVSKHVSHLECVSIILSSPCQSEQQ